MEVEATSQKKLTAIIKIFIIHVKHDYFNMSL